MRKICLYFIVLLFIGCSTDSDKQENSPSPNNKAASGSFNLFITDDLTEDYSEVWVSVKHVKIVGENGEKHSVFHGTPSQVFNLAELDGIGELLITRSLPIGNYEKLEITLERDLTMVNNDGVSEERLFASNTNAVKILLEGSILIEEDDLTSVAIDFDLSKFTVNDEGEVVPEVFLVKNVWKELKQTLAKVHGIVTSVEGDVVTLNHEASDGEITVVLTENTTIHLGENADAEIAVGDAIKVFGSYDSEESHVEAYRIRIKHEESAEETKPENTMGGDSGNNDSAENPNADSDSQKEDEVSDNENGNEVKDDDVNEESKNEEGNKEETEEENDKENESQQEQEKEDTTNSENDNESGDTSNSGNNHVEIEGIILAVEADQILIDIKHANFVPEENSLYVSINDDTQFARGSRDLLAIDQIIELSGMLIDGVITVKVVEIEGAGKDEHAEDKYAEIKAEVISVTEDSLQVMVMTTHNYAFDGTELTLDISNVQYKGGSMESLVAGSVIELKGSVDDANLFHLVKICFVEVSPPPAMAEIEGEVLELGEESILILVEKTEHAGDINIDDEVLVTTDNETHYADGRTPAVGDLVRLHATKNEEGLIARNIVVKHVKPVPVVKDGAVTAITDETITLELLTDGPGPSEFVFHLTETTHFAEGVMPVVGDLIKVIAFENDNQLLAVKVIVTFHEHPEPVFVHFSGIVTAISEASISLEVENEIVDIALNDNTAFIDGVVPQIGDEVEIKAFDNDGLYTAKKVWTKQVEPTPDPVELHFMGVVIEVTDTLLAIEMRDGDFHGNERSFQITSDTVFHEDMIPEMGDIVKINAIETEQGYVATEVVVKVVHPSPIEIHVAGIVSVISDTSITVQLAHTTAENEQTFIIDSETVFSNGVMPVEGDFVKLHAMETDAGFVAKEIMVKQIITMPPEFRAFGKIVEISDTKITIEPTHSDPHAIESSFIINDETIFDDDAVLEVGDSVIIHAIETNVGFVAKKIMLKVVIIDPPMPIVKHFFGKITEVGETGFTLNLLLINSLNTNVTMESVSFQTNENTEFVNAYVPMVDDYVSVEAAENENGYLATEVAKREIMPPIYEMPGYDKIIHLKGVVVSLIENQLVMTVSKSPTDMSDNVGTDITVVINEFTRFGHFATTAAIGTMVSFQEGDEISLVAGMTGEEFTALHMALASDTPNFPIIQTFHGMVTALTDSAIVITHVDAAGVSAEMEIAITDKTAFAGPDDVVIGDHVDILGYIADSLPIAMVISHHLEVVIN